VQGSRFRVQSSGFQVLDSAATPLSSPALPSPVWYHGFQCRVLLHLSIYVPRASRRSLLVPRGPPPLCLRLPDRSPGPCDGSCALRDFIEKKIQFKTQECFTITDKDHAV